MYLNEATWPNTKKISDRQNKQTNITRDIKPKILQLTIECYKIYTPKTQRCSTMLTVATTVEYRSNLK